MTRKSAITSDGTTFLLSRDDFSSIQWLDRFRPKDAG